MAWIQLCAVAILFLSGARTQDIAPANITYGGAADTVEVALADEHGGVYQVLPVWPLATNSMGVMAPDDLILEGTILLANASSQLQIAPDDIAVISCDPYTGNIQPSDVLGQAEDRNATAIVLYSTSLPSCRLGTQMSYSRVYTMISQNDTSKMLEAITSMGAVYARVAPRYAMAQGNPDANSTNGNNNSNNNNNNNNAFGPSPSTAVAMIILYSITGIITALFLIIIITGAVRAHRHPERYGPRNGLGRQRQSRARGLARAMLETIPIVKFGDRAEQQQQVVKPTDVELGETHGAVETAPAPDTNFAANEQETAPEGARHVNRTTESPNDGTTERSNESAGETSAPSHESGIAAAKDRTPTPPSTVEESSASGCSICTEDFQFGEDQRVLPCDHRFHPACVDPWLLNVSGTCPLCRIDLRPTSSRSDTGEEETGATATSEELAPPLGRASRRSIFGGFRPERMTREERVRALIEYRRANESQVEERGLRERLRRVLRVRTRRTGEQQSEDTGDGASS